MRSQKSDMEAYHGPGMELRGENRHRYMAQTKREAGTSVSANNARSPPAEMNSGVVKTMSRR